MARLSFPSLLLHFLTLLFPAMASPAPAVTPTPTSSPTPVCNQDNCYRALSASISAASAFCATYTTATVTASTGIPTYLPSTCGPSRVSSACTCVITKNACAFNAPTQVVQDSGFEQTPDPKISDSVHSGAGTPWHAFDTYGRDFFDSGDGFNQKGAWVVWGFDYGGVTGTATLTQNLTFCTSSHYAFSAYVGRRPDGIIFNATITVYLGNTVLVPTQKTCIDAADCKLENYPNGSTDYFRHITAAVPFPPPSAAELKVVIYRESNGNGTSRPPDGFDTLLDDVTISKVG
ncbi:MAG: hypothetical protein Q9228_002261 [Teloschistes exilis]